MAWCWKNLIFRRIRQNTTSACIGFFWFNFGRTTFHLFNLPNWSLGDNDSRKLILMPPSRVFKREPANAAKLDSLDNLTWYFQVWVYRSLCWHFPSQKCYLCSLENSFHQFVCDHLIREEFVLRSFSKHCAGTSPKQLAFWINNLTNPLLFKYSMLTRLSNDLEASRRSTKRPILLATTLVTRLSEYVSKRFESCTCRRRN